MRDALENLTGWVQGVHEHGMVGLVDVMPRLLPNGTTCDYAVVQAARVSYGLGTKTPSDDRTLLRYLMRHGHTSPFEMATVKFHLVMPIFVARQWMRHRTASVNEYSARYSVVPERCYRPEVARVQSTSNRQGSDEDESPLPGAEEKLDTYLDKAEAQHSAYLELLDMGVSREVARIGLPLGTYTEFYWHIDLHNLMGFLRLRLDPSAQLEIREYARVVYGMVRRLFPMTFEAFDDYKLGSITLTRGEIEALKTGRPLHSQNARERLEWEEKAAKLGPPVGE